MWGIDPKNCHKCGCKIPVRTNDDCRYFNDEFQALPKMVMQKWLKYVDHKNIEISLDTPFSKGMEKNFFILF